MEPRRVMRWMVLLIGIVWMAAHVVAPRHFAVAVDEERAVNESVADYRERVAEAYRGQLSALEAENADVVVGGPPQWLTLLAVIALAVYTVDWFRHAPDTPNRRFRQHE